MAAQAAGAHNPNMISRILGDPNIDLKKKRPREITKFAVNILKTFGSRYVPLALTALDEKVTKEVENIYNVFIEIIRGKNELYTRDRYPQTAAYIDSHNRGRAAAHIFVDLKKDALEFLPVPSKKEKKQSVVTAFKLLLRAPARVEDAQSKDLARLYFNTRAFIHGKKPIMYSEMLACYRTSSAENHAFCDKVLALLPACARRVEAMEELVILGFKGTFQEFLIHSTLKEIERRLSVEFSPSLQALLEKKLLNEMIRLDILYYLPNLSRLRVDDIDSDYKKVLIAMKLFLVSYAGARAQERSSDLLEMLIRASTNLITRNFLEKADEWLRLAMNHHGDFLEALDCFQDIVAAINPKNSRVEENFALYLFIFLWKARGRKNYAGLFLRLQSVEGLSLSLQSAYKFCEVNGENPSADGFNFFLELYVQIYELLTSKGKDVSQIEMLFLGDDPISLRSVDCLNTFTHGAQRVKEFLAKVDIHFFPILRIYIEKPNRHLEALLQDAKDLDIRQLQSTMVLKVLKMIPDGLDLDPAYRDESVRFILRVHGNYGLPDLERFEAYLNLLTKGRRSFELAPAVIEFMRGFCPGLNKRDLFFLLNFMKALPDEEMRRLQELKERWMGSEELHEKLIIDPRALTEIFQTIKAFTEALQVECETEGDTGAFKASIEMSLATAFLPPSQPLFDIFKVDKVTPEKVVWQDPYLSSHLGQLKALHGSSSGRVYLNWTVEDGSPTLFLAFFDSQKGTCRSQSITLDLDLRLAPKLYVMIYQLSQTMLSEELAGEYNQAYQFEDRNSWSSSFIGVREIIDTWKGDQELGLNEEILSKVLNFVKRVKTGYRSLYLTPESDREPREVIFLDEIAVASSGNIYTNRDQLSLLPRSVVVEHPEYFEPQMVARGAFPLFNKTSYDFQDMKMALRVTENGRDAIDFPLRMKIIFPSKDSEDVKMPEDTIERHLSDPLITLQVETRSGPLSMPLQYPQQAMKDPNDLRRYFSFHILQLKAMWYRALSNKRAPVQN